MIAGGNWWRANEIVIRRLTRQTATRYRCRDRADFPHTLGYSAHVHPTSYRRRDKAAASPSAGRPPGPRQRNGEGPARGRRDAGRLTPTYYWGYSYCGEDHLRCR